MPRSAHRLLDVGPSARPPPLSRSPSLSPAPAVISAPDYRPLAPFPRSRVFSPFRALANYRGPVRAPPILLASTHTPASALDQPAPCLHLSLAPVAAETRRDAPHPWHRSQGPSFRTKPSLTRSYSACLQCYYPSNRRPTTFPSRGLATEARCIGRPRYVKFRDAGGTPPIDPSIFRSDAARKRSTSDLATRNRSGRVPNPTGYYYSVVLRQDAGSRGCEGRRGEKGRDRNRDRSRGSRDRGDGERVYRRESRSVDRFATRLVPTAIEDFRRSEFEARQGEISISNLEGSIFEIFAR